MIVYDRPVRFEDVDAAGIVFFARFFGYTHEAMEALFAGLPNGYSGLVVDRKLGFPAVHVEADFSSPLRYGDTARISVEVLRVGGKSATIRFTLRKASDDTCCATITHTCAVCDLSKLRAVPMPADIRAVLDANVVTP